MNKKSKTLGDHILSTRSMDNSVPDLLAPRFKRMLSIIVDGREVRDIPLLHTKLGAQDNNEIYALVYSIVGCNMDTMFSSFCRLQPRPNKATPDFEATTLDGKQIRIEVCRIASPQEKKYESTLNQIAKRAEEIIKDKLSVDQHNEIGGINIAFFGRPPQPKDIQDASFEIAEMIIKYLPNSIPSNELKPIGPEFPVLSSLNTFLVHKDKGGLLNIRMTPNPQLRFRDAMISEFHSIFTKKSKKFSDYSDNYPVWLVMYIETSSSYPSHIVEQLAQIKKISSIPFERVLVGCLTAGVIFDQNGETSYSSFSDDS